MQQHQQDGQEQRHLRPVTTAPQQPRTPRNLGSKGRRIWDTVTAEFEIEEHNIPLLEIACRTADKVQALEKEIENHGYTIASPQGLRANPALAEQRAHIKQLATILATLNLPSLEDPDEQSRTRGAYRARRY
ncbi:P27 family phage terminase small subunit [Kocuria sp. CPCC 205263]|uniref:P27 family phage terminase small subunit n=1 Tax=Kocuria sp. CPCC 205263 TaxID=3073555 RepID=UPI0034D70CC0